MRGMPLTRGLRSGLRDCSGCENEDKKDGADHARKHSTTLTTETQRHRAKNWKTPSARRCGEIERPIMNASPKLSSLRIRVATAADMPAMIPIVNAAFAIEDFLEGTRTDEERMSEMMRKGGFL